MHARALRDRGRGARAAAASRARSGLAMPGLWRSTCAMGTVFPLKIAKAIRFAGDFRAAIRKFVTCTCVHATT